MDNLTPKGRNDGHIFDFSKINDRLYIGSDLCKGGVCLIHGEEFKALGVSVELNLSRESNELPPGDLETYFWLPVTDGYAPSPQQLDMGTYVINEAIENGKVVYIHCKNGHARSPSMVAAYFIRYKKMTIDEAIALVASKRPEVHIEDTQIKVLKDFYEKWSK